MWAPRQDWEAVPPGSFPFTIRCPRCGTDHDVADGAYRLGGVTPPRTSVLAAERPGR
jgi:hypothetical protein